MAGPRDYSGAMRALEPLGMTDMLRALREVDRLGELDFFYDAVGAGATARVRSAFQAARIERNVRGVDQPAIDALNQTLSGLPLVDQAEIVAHIAQVAGRAGDEVLAEGVTVALQTAAQPMAGAQAAAAAPVGPGGWNPPGNQPIPFYIGNEAHVAIALQYATMHAGQIVFTNSVPISTILGQMPGATPSGAAREDLALRPDIANVTQRQIYEIKPQTQASEAQTKLNLYLSIFRAAGMPMGPGSTSEPGTAGVLPAPAGYYMYECPAPGIILYQYRRGTYVPVPEPARERETAPDRRGFWRRMQEATGLTGAALVIYVIVSEGSRVAFPPRNAIPVP